MKTHRFFLITATFAALAMLSVPAFAGKKKNQDGDGMTVTEVLAKFDTNKDGKITGDEVTALRAAFDGADHDKLKHFDTNGDGKLDENEIAAIKPEAKKKKKNA